MTTITQIKTKTKTATAVALVILSVGGVAAIIAPIVHFGKASFQSPDKASCGKLRAREVTDGWIKVEACDKTKQKIVSGPFMPVFGKASFEIPSGECGKYTAKDAPIDSVKVASCPANPAPAKIKCGNGKVEEGEECDDGNRKNGDGCSSKCKTEQPEKQQPAQIGFWSGTVDWILAHDAGGYYAISDTDHLGNCTVQKRTGPCDEYERQIPVYDKNGKPAGNGVTMGNEDGQMVVIAPGAAHYYKFTVPNDNKINDIGVLLGSFDYSSSQQLVVSLDKQFTDADFNQLMKDNPVGANTTTISKMGPDLWYHIIRSPKFTGGNGYTSRREMIGASIQSDSVEPGQTYYVLVKNDDKVYGYYRLQNWLRPLPVIYLTAPQQEITVKIGSDVPISWKSEHVDVKVSTKLVSRMNATMQVSSVVNRQGAFNPDDSYTWKVDVPAGDYYLSVATVYGARQEARSTLRLIHVVE